MNERFRKEMDQRLSFVEWRLEDTEAVMRRIHKQRRRPVRQAVILAAALAALIAVMGIGYAEYESGILSALFSGREVRQEAENLIVFEPVTVTKNGVTATITEYLFDGQTVHLAGEMRNDTEEPLLCTLKPEISGADHAGGLFSFNGELVLIQPGETAQGVFRSDVLNLLQRMGVGWTVRLQAVALRLTGEAEESEKFPGSYDWEIHYGTERTEIMFEETLSFRMVQNQTGRPKRTQPAVREVRMEEYGYTIVIHEANFAAASSKVEFEIVPDDPKDIQAYGDEGTGGHEQLYRKYEIVNEEGKRLFADLTGGSDWGWTDRQTRLVYHFEFGPVESVPEKIVLVPVDDEGHYLMEEAAVVSING